MSTQTIPPTTLEELRTQGKAVDLIDVRTPAEFGEIHCPHARNVPLDSLTPEAVMSSRAAPADATLYVICRSGNRGKLAVARFQKLGFDNVVNVDGGILAWEAAGLPVVRGKKAMSLERQVRIAAGSFVLVGSLLGLLASPYFFALPIFVGSGLVFSGVTDTCGMGMLLAKMPWNRVGACTNNCEATQDE